MKLLREPLVHFLVIGALLFAVFAAAGNGTAAEAGANQIVITPGMVENLKVSFRRAAGRPPNARELQAAIDAYVREEILYREARALGIDRDLTLVRTLVAQRMEFLAEGDAAAAQPTTAELEAFYAAHRADYRRPDGAIPPFAEVRQAVTSGWQAAQRKAAANAAYEKLRAHYKVTVETPAAAPGAAP